MRPTRMVWMVLFGALPLATSGCGGTCSQYCETYVACAEEEFASGCGFEDSDEDVIAECEDGCDEAYSRLRGDEGGEADACLECVFDEIGDADSCDAGDLGDAIGDCEDECEEDGAEEFYEEFFDEFRPDFECNDVSGPGPAPPG